MAKSKTIKSGRPNITVKAKVSVPDFQFSENESEYYVRFEGPIVRGADRDPSVASNVPRGGQAPMAPPWKARVTDLEADELVSALIPTMVRTQLDEAYPGEGYIGREFRVVMHAPRGKARYRTCDIDEIDFETGGETEVSGDTE